MIKQNKRLTAERRLAADVRTRYLGHADFADVPGLGDERTARQRAVEIRHVDLVVACNKHINVVPYYSEVVRRVSS